MHLSILFSVLAVSLALPQLPRQSYVSPNRGSGDGGFAAGGFARKSNSGSEQSQGNSRFQQSQGSFNIDQRSQVSSNAGQQSEGSYDENQQSGGSFNGAQQSAGSFNGGQRSQGNFNVDQQSSQGSFDSGFSQSQRNFVGGQQSQGEYDSGAQSQQRFGSNFGSSNQVSCGENEVRHYDGSCIVPELVRNIFLYDAPEVAVSRNEAPLNIPKPKVIHNVVFVRTPDIAEGLEPIVIAPPQEKTVVYVLNKNGEIAGQRVIEIPAGPAQQPEVYYVNYEDGTNPQLPIGVDLKTALASVQSQQAQIIDAGAGSAGGNFESKASFTGSGSQGSTGGFVSIGAQGGSDNQDDSRFSTNENFQATVVTGNEGGSGIRGSSNQGGFKSQLPSQSYGSP